MVKREIYRHISLVMYLTDAPTGKTKVLLQAGCTDCIVMKDDDDDVSFVMLLSKEKTMICFDLHQQLLVVMIFRWMDG